MRKPLILLSLLLTLNFNAMSANSETEEGLIGPEPIVIIKVEQPVLSQRERIEQMASRGEIRSMMLEITAYCEEDGDITATGTKPRPGIGAIDPDVIPINSILYVEGVGIIVAEDVDDEEGYVLDLFIQKRQDALDWGRQHRKVYILNKDFGG